MMVCKLNNVDVNTNIGGLNLITCWKGIFEPEIRQDRRKYERMWSLQGHSKSTREPVP
jgi:hypothetical protein